MSEEGGAADQEAGECEASGQQQPPLTFVTALERPLPLFLLTSLSHAIQHGGPNGSRPWRASPISGRSLTHRHDRHSFSYERCVEVRAGALDVVGGVRAAQRLAPH